MTDREPLVEKYRPETWRDLQGNNTDIKELKRWVEGFTRGDTPQRLAGPPGVGKTSTANVIANEMEWPKESINASDARRTDEIAEIAERMKLRPVGAEYQLVILDEADSIPGSTNLNPLVDVLEDPLNPIIIICNEDYEVPDAIRKRSKQRKFSLGSGSVQAKVRQVAKQEEIDIGPATLSDLSERNNLRDALHDLQMLEKEGEIFDDEREYEENPFNVVEKIVRGKTSELPRFLPDNPAEFIWWIDENLRDEFRGVEAQVAYDLLARADKWTTRTRQTQNYKYWRYSTRLMKEVANARLTSPYSGYIEMNYPSAKRKWAPSASGDTAEAQLYQVLSGEDGWFGLSCNFLEFRKIYLPVILDLSLEERRQIANEHSLDGAALKALDLKEDQYDSWRKEEGSKMEEGSVFEWG